MATAIAREIRGYFTNFMRSNPRPFSTQRPTSCPVDKK
jgi:hypothetical protein